MKKYDIAIIGAGPGGYIAAAKAGSVGLKTALIEKNYLLGGTCLNRGCIPTKFLLNIADKYQEMKKIKKIGLFYDHIKINWIDIIKHKNIIIRKNSYGIKHLITSRNIYYYQGHAIIDKIEINNNLLIINALNQIILITSKNVIFAIGSNAKTKFLNTQISGKRIMNSDHLLEIKKIPGSLIIIGGGVIGCEFASIFSRFHTCVTILEHSWRLLPLADTDSSLELTCSFKNNQINTYMNIQVINIEEKNNNVKIFFKKKNEQYVHNIQSEYCLISIGRDVNVKNIFSNNVNLNSINKLIKNKLFYVNRYMETYYTGLYAIGDCINTPWLAHTASAEALIAIKHILKIKKINFIDYINIPMCVYSSPSIAWCGLSENSFQVSKEYIKISKFPLIYNGKFAAMLETVGFIKFITDRETNEILGVHIVGKNATELIAEPSFAIQRKLTINAIVATIHAHPTLYESIYETALMALNQPIHG